MENFRPNWMFSTVDSTTMVCLRPLMDGMYAAELGTAEINPPEFRLGAFWPQITALRRFFPSCILDSAFCFLKHADDAFFCLCVFLRVKKNRFCSLCAVPCSGVKEITLDIISRKIDCVCSRSRTRDLLLSSKNSVPKGSTGKR